MKILFFVHEGALSGANAALADFMGLLFGKGYELYLITPRLGELTQRVAPYTKEVFEIYYYGWTVGPNRQNLKKNQLRHRLRNLYAVHQIGSVIKKIQPDYCVTNTITIDVGALAAKKKGVKHIWFVHEFGESDHGFSFVCGMDKARKRMLSLSYKVAVNSLAVLKTFPASVKLKVLYNYVTPPQIEIAPLQKSDQMRFLLLGQIATSKNQSEAIRALAEARKRGYDFICPFTERWSMKITTGSCCIW
ncbi:MAG: hypothetical protein H3C36_11225 [Chitinophagaceae bacterium]|nr:hypothetical protein [Chitinophagaceae bacterium]